MGIHFALIAAGEGSRLRQEGVQSPKPLVRIHGEGLMQRLLRIFMQLGAESVSIIVNEQMKEVHEMLSNVHLPVPLNLVIKSTPDSFHSFLELYPFLKGKGRFCLTTVDPIFKEREFQDYIRTFQSSSCNALMGVTDYVDDEKPLYLETYPDSLRVKDYHNSYQPGLKYISAGVYCMDQKALELLPKADSEGIVRMRGFQRYLVQNNLDVEAYPFSKVIDIDHKEDILKAEEMLRDTED